MNDIIKLIFLCTIAMCILPIIGLSKLIQLGNDLEHLSDE